MIRLKKVTSTCYVQKFSKKGTKVFEEEKVYDIKERIAPRGCWTNRLEIPKLEYNVSGTKIITINGKEVDYNFYGTNKTNHSFSQNTKFPLSDSSYLEDQSE